jgi:hypothetical protein
MRRAPATSWILFAALGCASSPPPATTGPQATASPPRAATVTPPPSKPAPLRKPEEILADTVKATGGEAAWNAHKTVHVKMETTLQGMGIGGAGERFQTSTDKSLTTMEMAGLGRVREGTNGKVAWTEEPVHGIRYLDGAEAEQMRIGSAWNPELRANELFVKLESTTEPGPDGAALECVVATPKIGAPLRTCYDARTHLQVTQSGVHPGPEGDMPFRNVIKTWKDVGGVKMPFESSTQLGPVTTLDRITSVTFDEAMDDKMFDPPRPDAAAPAKTDKPAKPPKGKSK